MRIFLTGTAGFIGANVAEALLDRGDEVIGADNLNDAYDVKLKAQRLSLLEGRSEFRFARMDISEYEQVRALWEEYGPFDAVLNLAARAGVRASVIDPWVYYSTNTIGTLNLLEMCRQAGPRKFVLASTSSMYGASSEQPFSEEQRTNKPISPYAASKGAAEQLCYTYHFLHGLDVTVFRYFTVYGPAGRPDMSMLRFVKWITEGETVSIYGDGSQSRDFTFVTDIARGTVLGLRELGYEVINLGNDRPIGLLEVVRLVEEATGKKARLSFEEGFVADVPRTWASITKAEELLGWSPQIRLEDGVAKTIDWYHSNREWAKEIKL